MAASKTTSTKPGKGTSNKKSTAASSKNIKSTNSRNVRETAAKGAKRTEKPDTEKRVRPERQGERLSDSMREEIILAVTLLVSILLFLSYIDLCGTVGDGLNYVVFGMMGIFGYLFPFLLFLGVAFGLANRNNRVATRKIISAVAFFICVAGLFELASGFDPENGWTDYFVMSAEAKNGGGILGGAPVKLLCPLFDTVATTVILIIGMVICLMLLTGKELFAYLRKLSGEAIEEHKLSVQEREQRRMERELEAYEEGEEYRERRARIVTFRKNNTEDGGMSGGNEQEDKQEESIRFVDALKARGRKESGTVESKAIQDGTINVEYKNPLRDTVVEMKEIAPSLTEINTNPLDNIPISGQYQKEGSFYEEELTRKFGSKNVGNAPEENVSVQQENTDGQRENMPVQQENTDGQRENMPVQPENTMERLENVSVMPESPMAVSECAVLTRDSAPASENMAPALKESTPERQSVRESQRQREDHADGVDIAAQIEQTPIEKKYEFPPLELLAKPKPGKGANERELKETAMKLQRTLESFGVRVSVTNISCGPAVTQYELQPEQGVKVSQITKLSDDIKLNLAAADIRIEAPIPGKAAVGIEVPNKENSAVMLRELLESDEFKKHKSKLAFAVGKNISGQIVVSDIAKMPHMLIAGATGSGKSVCINTIIMSILYKADPKDVRLIMVDPKVVELSVYNGIPHLLIPVVTDPKKASAALNWAVMEMTDRYKKFADLGVRDLSGYNEKVGAMETPNPAYPRLPQIVIIVDELADLMMVASANEVEDAICRLAQMARAAGLHLIIATQRPSVNVITGVIKANVPSRVAFAVTSAVDSRTILDGVGAERLLGKGDMLFFPSGLPKPVRIQGAFVSDSEVSAVVDFIKEQNRGAETYNEEVHQKIMTASTVENAGGGAASNGRDDYFIEAGRVIIERQKASIGMLQREYSIGFNRAARIMDQLTAAGVVGPEEGTKPRKILMSMEEFESNVVG